MSYINQILKEYWINYQDDLFPKDRSMKILQDKQIAGMSSENVRFLLNKLTQYYANDGVYLEVGIYQGCSLLSAALNNATTRCIGIDNFSLFNQNSHNEMTLKANLQKIDGCKNIEYYNLDYIDAFNLIFSKEPGLKIGMYFYDGPHSYNDQLKGMNIMLPHLAPKCAIMVDDINRDWIEQANQDFLTANALFKSVFKIKTNNPQSNWWNGIEVLVRE